MFVEKNTFKIMNTFQSWIITLSILFFSLSSTAIALVCIYALPNRSIKPFEGALFFIGGAIVLVGLLIFRWKKEKLVFTNTQVLIKETVSDKIIKWVTVFFCFGYAFWGFALALICIYALPDKIMQPKIGAIYFCASAVVVASFIFVVWKNWVVKKHT
ncbi:MAG: hypothetical protein GY710_25610 [Desulfobacteraceae bacterium]|nr:hypothetical protein [Desulfobacteraceae bacterium]